MASWSNRKLQQPRRKRANADVDRWLLAVPAPPAQVNAELERQVAALHKSRPTAA